MDASEVYTLILNLGWGLGEELLSKNKEVVLIEYKISCYIKKIPQYSSSKKIQVYLSLV